MQHPDEGTIHAWLDGALTPDEAAQIDAHVKDCAQCAAAVAEARGFIAASSRILTALDNAPRGVIPATAIPKKRFNPTTWRIAASVLVIAGGTFLVARNQGSQKTVMQEASTADSGASAAAFNVVADSAQVAQSVAAAAPSTAPSTAPATRSLSAKVPLGRGVEAARPTAAAPNGNVASAGRRDASTQVANAAPERRAPTMEKVAAPTGVSPDHDLAASNPAPSPAASPAATAFAPVNQAAPTAMDMAVAAQPLKVIGTPRRLGAKVTVYEIGGDTVTFTESVQVTLSEVVVTGIASTRVQGRAAGAAVAAPTQAAPKAAAPMAAADSQRPPAPPIATAAQVPRTVQPDDSTVVHTISWVDPSTGNTLSLSGRMTVDRLQQLKLRIEKERAAAKKTP